MVLKQRFADGRTAYTNIGEQWLYIQQAATEFKDLASEYFRSPELEKDCIGLIQYGNRKTEPIYKDFPQWIYSNDGLLFMTLTIPMTEPVHEKHTLKEARDIHDSYK